MADLLPSTPDTSAAEGTDPRVIGVDSDDADDLIGALSSTTARELLAALHEEPANPAKLADQVDTTIQNAQYHLEKLETAGLIEVIDTAYSEKGREMQVYAPSDRPLVVVAGGEDETTGVRAALSRLLGALGALGLSSLLVEQLVGDGFVSFGAQTGGDDGAAPGGGGADGADSGDGGFSGAEADTETEAAAAEAADNATATAEATGTPTQGADATSTPAPEATGTSTSTPMDTPAATEAATPTRTPVELVSETANEAARMADPVASLPPGLLFFAGGATVLLAGFALWYLRQ